MSTAFEGMTATDWKARLQGGLLKESYRVQFDFDPTVFQICCEEQEDVTWKSWAIGPGLWRAEAWSATRERALWEALQAARRFLEEQP